MSVPTWSASVEGRESCNFYLHLPLAALENVERDSKDDQFAKKMDHIWGGNIFGLGTAWEKGDYEERFGGIITWRHGVVGMTSGMLPVECVIDMLRQRCL